jgi:hypothetical protein
MSERLFGFDPDLGYIAAHARPSQKRPAPEILEKTP